MQPFARNHQVDRPPGDLTDRYNAPPVLVPFLGRAPIISQQFETRPLSAILATRRGIRVPLTPSTPGQAKPTFVSPLDFPR